MGRQRCLCIGSKHTIRRLCPNQVCGYLYDEIVQSHFFEDPNFCNTDISKWVTEPWELAKCYINARGYKDKTSAKCTDAAGLLSIVINDMEFHLNLDTTIQNVTPPQDVFTKLLRNELFVSTSDEICILQEAFEEHSGMFCEVTKALKDIKDTSKSRFDSIEHKVTEASNTVEEVRQKSSAEQATTETRIEGIVKDQQKISSSVNEVRCAVESVRQQLSGRIDAQEKEVQDFKIQLSDHKKEIDVLKEISTKQTTRLEEERSGTSGDNVPPAPTELPPPQASPEAVAFLESLAPEEDFKYLIFEDHLVTTSDTGKELGEFAVTIEPTKHKGVECFLVHANSHGSIDGVPCGTSITAYVGNNLETLEQQHHEYVKLENCPLDRKTFIVRQEDGYVINRVITQGEDIQRSSRTVKHDQMKGFISEGSNLLLHRLLIEKGIPDNLQMISFDSDTNLCPAIYKRLEERTQTVENTEVKVFGIERTINSTIDLPTTWQSYFMKDGHLTSRVQVGSPVTMKLSYVPAYIMRDEEPPKPTFEKQPLKWEEDSQLYSQFLDRKEELKADHAKYVRHHPELKALLADFMQFLLLRKPDDVIAFAAEYFAAFSTSMPSPSPYLASNNVTPFPNSRTNTKIEQLRAPTR